MNVRELIDYLHDMDGEMEVFCGYDYGDRGHNIVAEEVEEVTEETVVWSDYHRMYKLQKGDDCDDFDEETIYGDDMDEDDEKVKKVVFLM